MLGSAGWGKGRWHAWSGGVARARRSRVGAAHPSPRTEGRSRATEGSAASEPQRTVYAESQRAAKVLCVQDRFDVKPPWDWKSGDW